MGHSILTAAGRGACVGERHVPLQCKRQPLVAHGRAGGGAEGRSWGDSPRTMSHMTGR